MNKSWVASSQWDLSSSCGFSPPGPACVWVSPRHLLAAGPETSPPGSGRHPQGSEAPGKAAWFSALKHPVTFLHTQLCVDRAVCDRRYRPVKCLKWRISGNLTFCIAYNWTRVKQDRMKGGVGDLGLQRWPLRPCGLLPTGFFSELAQPHGVGGVEPEGLASQAQLCHKLLVWLWEKSLTSVDPVFCFGKWKGQGDTKIQCSWAYFFLWLLV